MKKLSIIVLTISLISISLSSCKVASNEVPLEDKIVTEQIKEIFTQDSIKLIVPYTFKSSYDEWSDGWYIDLVMSVFPDFSYEVAQDFTFMKFDDFKKKYSNIFDVDFIKERWSNTMPDIY